MSEEYEDNYGDSYDEQPRAINNFASQSSPQSRAFMDGIPPLKAIETVLFCLTVITILSGLASVITWNVAVNLTEQRLATRKIIDAIECSY